MKTPKGMTVSELIEMLRLSVTDGHIKPTDTVWIASDEEGNSFSRIVPDAVVADKDGRVVMYPIYPECL